MVLNIFSCLQKLLHFIQKYKQKAIKLLKHISFAVGELCICLSKILNQLKICNRFVHFSNPRYIRLPTKVAYAQGFEGDASPRTVAYSGVREEQSTDITYKLPAEIELCRKSIFTLKNLFILFSENKNNLRLCLNNLFTLCMAFKSHRENSQASLQGGARTDEAIQKLIIGLLCRASLLLAMTSCTFLQFLNCHELRVR